MVASRSTSRHVWALNLSVRVSPSLSGAWTIYQPLCEASRYCTLGIAEPLAPNPHLCAGAHTSRETPLTASSHSHYPSAGLRRRLTTAQPFVLNGGQVYFESSASSQPAEPQRSLSNSFTVLFTQQALLQDCSFP